MRTQAERESYVVGDTGAGGITDVVMGRGMKESRSDAPVGRCTTSIAEAARGFLVLIMGRLGVGCADAKAGTEAAIHHSRRVIGGLKDWQARRP